MWYECPDCEELEQHTPPVVTAPVCVRCGCKMEHNPDPTSPLP